MYSTPYIWYNLGYYVCVCVIFFFFLFVYFFFLLLSSFPFCSLKKKWKKIEEFDARRSEFKTICMKLLKANRVMLRYFSISCISKILIVMIRNLENVEIVVDALSIW